MKKLMVVLAVVVLGVYIFGCQNKETAPEGMLEPLSMETLGNATVPVSETVNTQANLPAAEPKLESLPPAGPYKPTTQEIQTALSNAGYYAGKIDGKKGPMTKKAIEEFQRANNLQADGKVGPKTWEVLSGHLSAMAVTDPAVTETKPSRLKKR